MPRSHPLVRGGVKPMAGKEIEKRKFNFCCRYAMLGNPEEAALKAGYPQTTALKSAVDCLNDKNCRELIAAVTKNFSDVSSVKAGLRRLAFGNCSDAVALAFAEEAPTPEAVGKLDLFNVSEIRKDKGGGVEIKFFDRLKALEKLYELEASQDGKAVAEGLIAALTASAENDNNEDN